MKTLFTFSALAMAAASFGQACCSAKKPVNPEAEFLAMARQMEAASEGKQACCRTTAVKTVVKGEAGCCNAPGEPKVFKVFVANRGYEFYGCQDSAGKGRKSLIAQGMKVGRVQRVTARV